MTILVTGGSGFLGTHLIQSLLRKHPDVQIRTLSRSGNAVQRLLVECRGNRGLVPIIGDIRDLDSVRYVMRDVDTVIHLAAMKHIDLCELYPLEAVATNINGTRNLLDSFNGNTFIGMSTDKAVESTGCYGATKLITEKLVLDKALRRSGGRYMVIRSGNFFGSTSSVIEKWRRQLKQGNRIDITDPAMTKFFIDVGTIVDFVVEIIENGESGNVYIPYQKALTLADLATAVIDLYGNPATQLSVIGIRPSEKSHEKLFIESEKVSTPLTDNLSSNAQRLTVDEIKVWLRNLELEGD